MQLARLYTMWDYISTGIYLFHVLYKPLDVFTNGFFGAGIKYVD